MTNDHLYICRKRRYPSQKNATDMVHYLTASGRVRPHELSVYKCHTCHNWHLTSRPSGKPANRSLHR